MRGERAHRGERSGRQGSGARSHPHGAGRSHLLRADGDRLRAASGRGVVVATGGRAEFGRIALGLGERQPETEFQVGLRRFSMLLLQVAVALTALILVANLALHRPLLDWCCSRWRSPWGSPLSCSRPSSAAVPPLAPGRWPAGRAGQTAGLHRGPRRRRRPAHRQDRHPDRGPDRISRSSRHRRPSLGTGVAAGPARHRGRRGVGGNALDVALWAAPGAATAAVPAYRRLGVRPFDHDRLLTSSLVDARTDLAWSSRAPRRPSSRAAEAFRRSCARCSTRSSPQAAGWSPSPPSPSRRAAARARWEQDLDVAGLLVFHDPPRPTPASLRALAELGITVKVATGDNPAVARKVCTTSASGRRHPDRRRHERLDDAALADAAATPRSSLRVPRAEGPGRPAPRSVADR